MNVIASTDLWFPTQRDPVGPDHPDHYRIDPDPLRYVVWINPGRGHGEQAPRQALHLVACRNGDHP